MTLKAQVIIISYKQKECWILYPFVEIIKKSYNSKSN